MRSVFALLIAALCFAARPTHADTLRVMTTGLGAGTVTGTGINCGAAAGATDCTETLPATGTILLTATPSPGSAAVVWGGNCPDDDASTPANQCRVALSSFRSVRAKFDRATPVTPLTEAQISDVAATRSGIGDYLDDHPDIDSVAEFIAALPLEYRQNWLLMTRSESLQTGSAAAPRLLLPNARAANAFSVGFRNHTSDPSYPAYHPNAIEFMQWDEARKTFRFHEIALTPIPGRDDRNPPAGDWRFPGRAAGVEIDDHRCFACHSTRNVLNRGTTPGTDGVSRDVPAKSKPNWDAYDSWGGQLAFNRDRIYKGSVEAATFRKTFNLWTWQANPHVRGIIEQLELQPPNVPDGTMARRRTHARDQLPPGSPPPPPDDPGYDIVYADDRITRVEGGASDGHIVFGFDPPGSAVAAEPQPTGSGVDVAYAFDRRMGTSGTPALRNPTVPPAPPPIVYSDFVTLHHSTRPRSDAGRGVNFLSNLHDPSFLDDGTEILAPNTLRVIDEVKTHRYATGNVPVDVRALTVAIAADCITMTGGADIASVQSINPALSPAVLAFFDERNGLTFDQLYDDTRRRQNSLPLRKVDIQKLTLDRTADPYVFDELGPTMGPPAPEPINGMIQEHGGATSGVAGGSGGLDTSLRRLRQEIFRRPIDRTGADQTVMGGVIVDREDNRDIIAGRIALFRYFLEPLGVSVDKWSTSTRGRSRTYTFSGSLLGVVRALGSNGAGSLRESLGIPPGVADVCPLVMPMVDTTFAALPSAIATPTYTDIQRIFNKSCIECHGGLGYPPYRNYGGVAVPLDLSENETPAPGERRLWRSLRNARDRLATPACAPSEPECAVGSGIDPATSWLYQRITDNGVLAHPYNPGQPYITPDHPTSPDVADERCPEGLMPCGGPPLSKTDILAISRWIVGGAPNTEGDPHIKTVDGKHYDFQAVGEFTMLRDEDMELQVRQSPVTTAAPITEGNTGLTACVSVNSAVALRVGTNRVTYQPELRQTNFAAANQRRKLVLRIDGKPVDLGEHPLSSGGRVLPTSAPGGIQVQYPGGTSIVITPGYWDPHQIAFMNIDVRHARAVQGVMGAIAPGNWLPALPNGAQLGARPAALAARFDALYRKFASAWRVSDESSLFDYEAGLNTRAFTLERWPAEGAAQCVAPPMPGVMADAPVPTPTPRAEAERLCAALPNAQRRKNCVADVMVTGAPVFAETYLLTQKLASLKMPRKPQLRAPANNAVVPAVNAAFAWTQTPSSGGGKLTYRHCVWSASTAYDFNTCVITDRGWSLSHAAWFGYAVAAAVALLLSLILLIATGTRYLLILLLALGVAILSGIQLLNIHRNGTTVQLTVNRLDAGKVYFWKVAVEDENGTVTESETRRFVVR